jgi:NAD(P)-dependent dehydrogenase (short-subunit alcohol dehydrogenase family)
MRDTQKVALITGANKGIGFEVARLLAAAGWTVLVGARNESMGREAVTRLQADGLNADFIHIDLNDRESVKKAAQAALARFGKLNLLVNNAGIAPAGDGPPSTVDIGAMESAMRTNYIGTVAVTQAMLPLLKRAVKAQIINVSSELGSISQQTDTTWKFSPVKVLAYCASKAALNMFTVQLAYEFRDGSIAVNSINPGYTATDLNGNSGPQTVSEGAAEIVRVALLDAPVSGQFLETAGQIPW